MLQTAAPRAKRSMWASPSGSIASDREAIHMAFPKADSELVPYSTNWNARIVAAPGDFSLSAAQAAAYTPLHSAYLSSVAALQAAVAAGTRSKALYATRDTARVDLLRYGRELYAIVQAS